MNTPAPGWRRMAAYAVAVAVLGLVFAAYQSPHLIVDFATRVWACF